jgi:hypothetical protein
MIHYAKYGPYISIGSVIFILLVLWAIWGGKNYEFVGLKPLDPETLNNYSGSIYSWGNTQAIPENVCLNENIKIDNTPTIPQQFTTLPQTQTSLQTPLPQTSFLQTSLPQTSLPQTSLPQTSLPPAAPQITIPAPQITIPAPQITIPAPQITLPSNGTRKKKTVVSKGERLCCKTMERIYGAPFPSVWPTWLVNPETGEKLELDCYNEELKIAVEYNGEQHYKWPNFTNQSYDQFINQVRRDTFKMNVCDKNGIYLITVPYNVPHDKIPTYIMSYLPETIQKRIQEERTLENLT